MYKTTFAALLVLISFVSPLSAQSFDPSLFKGWIGGLHLSNDQTSPNTVLDIESGSAVDSLAATFIKTVDTSKSTTSTWTSGVGAGGMAPGLTIASNHWYSVFLIENSGSADVYFDQPSVVTTNAPSGTTAYRHLGWFRTDASSNIEGMLCADDTCWWKQCECNTATVTYDYVASNPCSTPIATAGNQLACTTTITLAHIPPGAPVTAILNLDLANISIPPAAIFWVLTSPDTPYRNGIGVTGSEPQIPDVMTTQALILTNSNAQVLSTVTSNPAGAGSSPTVFIIDSKGWIYHRNLQSVVQVATGIGTPSIIGTIGTSPGNYTSVNLPINSSIVSGNAIGVCIGINSTNAVTVASISDGLNTYSKVAQQTVSPNTDIELWYAQNISAVSTITVNLSGSTGVSSGISALVSQISGISISPLDQFAKLSDVSGSSLSVNTSTLIKTNEIALGCSFQVPTSTYLGAAGFTNVGVASAPSGNGLTWMDYRKTPTSAAVSYTPSWTGSGRIGAIVGTFKGQ